MNLADVALTFSAIVLAAFVLAVLILWFESK